MFKNELMGTSVLGVIDGTTVTIEMIIVRIDSDSIS